MNSSKNKKIGNFGEKVASEYLEKNQIKILHKNFHSRYGEIDIIAENSKYIIFVEVKTRNNITHFKGVEAVNRLKINRIINTAYIYLQENGSQKQPRFDVVEVYMDNRSNVKKINHIQNAFDLEGYNEIF